MTGCASSGEWNSVPSSLFVPRISGRGVELVAAKPSVIDCAIDIAVDAREEQRLAVVDRAGRPAMPPEPTASIVALFIASVVTARMHARSAIVPDPQPSALASASPARSRDVAGDVDASCTGRSR